MPQSDILALFESIPQDELSSEKGRELALLIAERASAKFDRSVEGQRQSADFNRSAFTNRGKMRGEFQIPMVDLSQLTPQTSPETESTPVEPLDLEGL